MVSRGQGRIVLWPHYFDARRSRSEGRRVAAALAVAEPDARWVESAARKAGFTATLEEESKHPSIPYKVVGRVLVETSEGKESVLRKVGERIAGPRE